MKYGILGSGEATEPAVHEALADILKKDKKAEFLIHARRSPQGAVSSVYDFIVDNECSFVSYTKVDDRSPKPLLNLASKVITTDDPMKSIINDAEQILLLWDETNTEGSEKIAIMCADEGLSILDLSMALTPIVVDTTAEKPTKSVANATVGTEDDNAVMGFSRDELMGMTVSVLRRQAKAMGIEVGIATKEQIVNMILNDGVAEVASDVHVPQEPQAVVVYWENGSYMTVHVPLKDIKALLS